QLGEKSSGWVARVGEVAEHVDAGEAGHGEVGLDVDPSALPLRQSGGAGQGRRLEAPRPDSDPGPDRRAVGKQDVARADFIHRGARVPGTPGAAWCGGGRERARSRRGAGSVGWIRAARGGGSLSPAAIVTRIGWAGARAVSPPVGPAPTMTKFRAP